MKAENYVVSMTAFETLLLILILIGTTAIGGVALGFYLGSRVSETRVADHTAEALKLCEKIVAHEDDRVAAWKANHVLCEEEVDRYRTWILGIEKDTKMRATVTHSAKTSLGGP